MKIFWAGTHPKCFSEQEFRVWASTPGVSMFPCHDCTAVYQSRMIREHRCENPTFIFEDENED